MATNEIPRFTRENLEEVKRRIWSISDAPEFLRMLMGLPKSKSGTPPYWYVCEAVENALITREAPAASEYHRGAKEAFQRVVDEWSATTKEKIQTWANNCSVYEQQHSSVHPPVSQVANLLGMAFGRMECKIDAISKKVDALQAKKLHKDFRKNSRRKKRR